MTSLVLDWYHPARPRWSTFEPVMLGSIVEAPELRLPEPFVDESGLALILFDELNMWYRSAQLNRGPSSGSRMARMLAERYPRERHGSHQPGVIAKAFPSR